MYHIFSTHSSVDGHFSCFHVLVIVNSAAMDIRVHVCFWIMVFWLWVYGFMTRNGIAGSYVALFFSFLRSLQTEWSLETNAAPGKHMASQPGGNWGKVSQPLSPLLQSWCYLPKSKSIRAEGQAAWVMWVGPRSRPSPYPRLPGMEARGKWIWVPMGK